MVNGRKKKRLSSLQKVKLDTLRNKESEEKSTYQIHVDLTFRLILYHFKTKKDHVPVKFLASISQKMEHISNVKSII